MSQSASHPSIPSVISGASSLSGDGSVKDKECEQAVAVPSILRTGETVKARLVRPQQSHEDDESRYYCDDENDSEDDSEDEVLVIGRKKPSPQKPVMCGTQASKPKA
jgi:[calcium/calmodulin-dependent protein kinase] kinase